MGGGGRAKKKKAVSPVPLSNILGGRFRGALTLPMGVRNRHIGVRKRT